MRARIYPAMILVMGLMGAATSAHAQDCLSCHQKNTPGIVSDWKISKHAKANIGCHRCHGDDHKTSLDFANARIPTPETCAPCHDARVKQFKGGKHALAWVAMKAMPTVHRQPMALTAGMKGCGGCHKIGLKSEADLKELRRQGWGFGTASCDACHTRHVFSVREAKQPQACQTCHMGIDHPQWEMYSASKHGVRYLLKQSRTLPPTVAAPTCQTCHMPDGNHGIRTAWGSLAVRLPMPDNKQWAADRTSILQALGVLDPEENPAERMEMVKVADMARLNEDEWQMERDKMIKTCNRCHSVNFAKGELAKGDQMIAAADRLLAEGIRIVAGLYRDGILAQPKSYAYPFPDLLTLHDAPTVIEQKLSAMFLEQRSRAFQGTFHANPAYALRYGWSKMQRSLTEIKEMAADLRAKAEKK